MKGMLILGFLAIISSIEVEIATAQEDPCTTTTLVCAAHGVLTVDSRGICICACDAGWEGARCQREVLSLCAGSATRDCVAGTPSEPDADGFCKCICDFGYHGLLCQRCWDVCKNGGTIGSMPDCGCTCPLEWTGLLCEQCLPAPGSECANGINVLDESNACVCECFKGWDGLLCDQAIPPSYLYPIVITGSLSLWDAFLWPTLRTQLVSIANLDCNAAPWLCCPLVPELVDSTGTWTTPDPALTYCSGEGEITLEDPAIQSGADILATARVDPAPDNALCVAARAALPPAPYYPDPI